VADVRFERKKSLTGAAAATWLTALAEGFSQGGDVVLPVGDGGTVTLRPPDEVRAEFEVEIEGDQVEVELEFTWKLGATTSTEGSATTAG
jgi:amphi-Trp domain-containing protein